MKLFKLGWFEIINGLLLTIGFGKTMFSLTPFVMSRLLPVNTALTVVLIAMTICLGQMISYVDKRKPKIAAIARYLYTGAIIYFML